MKKYLSATNIVTDHALVRWLDRAQGIDMEWFREYLADQVRDAVKVGASSVTIDGVSFRINNGRLVTVIASDNHIAQERAAIMI